MPSQPPLHAGQQLPPSAPHQSPSRAATGHDDRRPEARSGAATALRPLVLAGLMAGLTAVLSYVRIPLPFTPVPITGQTLGVMLSGLLLGPRWGLAAQLAYLLLGLAGAPVFAGGAAGPATLFGATGGFLLSYPLAAGLTGLLARPATARGDRPASVPGTAALPAGVPSFTRAFLAAVVGGILLVYAVGAPWLAVVTGTAWPKVWVAAVFPFIPGDLVKALVAAWLSRRVRRALGTGTV